LRVPVQKQGAAAVAKAGILIIAIDWVQLSSADRKVGDGKVSSAGSGDAFAFAGSEGGRGAGVDDPVMLAARLCLSVSTRDKEGTSRYRSGPSGSRTQGRSGQRTEDKSGQEQEWEVGGGWCQRCILWYTRCQMLR